MINKTMNFFEKTAQCMGLFLKMPRPGKSMVNISILTNGFTGIALLAFGAALNKIYLLLLGAVAIAGAVILALAE